MSNVKGILIYNRNEEERNHLCSLLKAGDNSIFATADALEALHALQKEDIRVVLASSDFTTMTREEFRKLVEKVRPGVTTVFTSRFFNKDKEFTVDIGEFLNLINDHIRKENILNKELSEVKQYAYSIADRLLQIFAVNDRYFFNNDHLVAEMSRKIAVLMQLDDSLVEAIPMAALLRDIGRVVIHQQILEETKKLNQIELTPIKAHPIHTMQILRLVRFPWNLDSIIIQHHEHYDGSGYPVGLKGREITIGARIIAVVDAFYAMTTDRPYRKALPRDWAIAEMKKNAGSQFDPEVVEVFLSVIGEEAAELNSESSLLIFERENNIAAMVKLSSAAADIDVIHATSSIEAISRIRQKDPKIIILDTEALEPETFMRFYQTARQSAPAASRFLMIISGREPARSFGNEVEYITRPLSIEQLTSTIRKLLLETAPAVVTGEVRGLTGTLEDFNLIDIIQILSLGLKTAKVETTHGRETGMLFLLRGKIVYASTGSLSGPDAFFELIRWKKGFFYIMHGQTIDEVNVTVDTMHLLMDACSVMDEKTSPHYDSSEKAGKPDRSATAPPDFPGHPQGKRSVF
ncbi:MAG: HD domain-containing phosphohydrolase [Thermodesulfovibrionales bacterium]